MRKYMLLILVMAVVMSFAGVSVAAESDSATRDEVLMAEAAELAATTGVVGDDIEIGEGEMKIVSLPDDLGDGGGTDAVAPLAPDELMLEQMRVDAANEGSVSMDNDSSDVMVPDEDGDTPVSNSDSVEVLSDEELADLAAQSGVVGEDIEIGDGEMKIVSAPEVVGEDIEIGDDMAKIVSVEEEASFNWPLAAGIAGSVIVLGGVIFLLIKKSHKPVTAP